LNQLSKLKRLFGRLQDIRYWTEGLLPQYWSISFRYTPQ